MNASKNVNVSVDDGLAIWSGRRITLVLMDYQEDSAICDVVVDLEEGTHRWENHTK